MKIVFLARQVRRSIRRGAIPVLSPIIVSILITQSAISLLWYPIKLRLRKPWPFLDYPMYSIPHYEGERISHIVVIGLRDELGEVPIKPEDLGIDRWHFRFYIEALLGDDLTIIREFVQRYEMRQGTHLSGVRVEDRGPLLSKNGFVPASPQILANHSLVASADK